MKKLLINFLLIFTIISFYSCNNKELTPVNNVDITPGNTTGNTSTGGDMGFNASDQTLILQGTFKNGVHTTSGTAKLYKKGTTYTLVFDSFKTDSGPDLRIYLAEDNNAKNFIELTELKNTGNFYLVLPDNADVNKRMNVLIWCKQFSVLFGSATLAAPSQM